MRPGTHQPPEVEDHNQWQTVRTLLPYLWPAGERKMKMRVLVAILCLTAAKVVIVSIPYIYKEIIAAMTAEPVTPEQLAVAVPVFLIVGYGIARLLSPAFGELRDAVFARVGQQAAEKLPGQRRSGSAVSPDRREYLGSELLSYAVFFRHERAQSRSAIG